MIIIFTSSVSLYYKEYIIMASHKRCLQDDDVYTSLKNDKVDLKSLEQCC